MEDQCSPLSWAFYYQEEGVEELKQSLFYSTLELESAVISAHEEISRKDEEIIQLKDLLSNAIKEKDEFQAQIQQLLLEKHLLFQQVQLQTQTFSPKQPLQDPPISSATTSNLEDIDQSSPSDSEDNTNAAIGKPLPENGKFLQAVMEAGPLLQTLLLAGPMPRWQHPPPQLSSGDIPPVTISSMQQESCLVSPSNSGGLLSSKRGSLVMNRESFDFSPKYRKVCSPIIIDPNIVIPSLPLT